MTKKRVKDVLDWMELILVDAPNGKEPFDLDTDIVEMVLTQARDSLGV